VQASESVIPESGRLVVAVERFVHRRLDKVEIGITSVDCTRQNKNKRQELNDRDYRMGAASERDQKVTGVETGNECKCYRVESSILGEETGSTNYNE
jgi:Ni2+-binding GTPase involved in maturation of urease and hydrogenase